MGKSTFLNVLALAARPQKLGRFLLCPRPDEVVDIGALWAANDDDKLTAARCHGIGYVLQQGGLLPYLSVRKNIELGLAIQGRRDPGRVQEIAAQLGIDKLLSRLPQTLSTGQRQRVAIARALVHRPSLLLADEPTASVHPALADSILALLVEQAHHSDAALVLVTHDEARATRHGFEIVRIASVEGATTELSVVRRKMPAVATAQQ